MLPWLPCTSVCGRVPVADGYEVPPSLLVPREKLSLVTEVLSEDNTCRSNAACLFLRACLFRHLHLPV